MSNSRNPGIAIPGRWASARIGLMLLWAVATVLLVLAAVQSAAGRPSQPPQPPIDQDLLAQLKAVAVSHLPGHTEWPEHRFNDQEEERAQIVIMLIGEDGHGFERYLVQAVRERRRAHERDIVLRRLLYPIPRPGEEEIAEEDLERFREQLREAHVLYIGLSERVRRRYRQMLEWVADHDVLTISFIAGFAERGGMLGLTVRENRLAMDANMDVIRKTDLKISSRLLRLVRIVMPPQNDQLSRDGN